VIGIDGMAWVAARGICCGDVAVGGVACGIARVIAAGAAGAIARGLAAAAGARPSNVGMMVSGASGCSGAAAAQRLAHMS
jgi:hypothetical protein